MTVTAVPASPQPDPDLATRFACDIEPFLDVLLRGARRLTRNEPDAEDLLQDALLHAYTGFHGFQEGTNLKAWLFRIMYNRWVSTYRTKQRRPAEVSVESVTELDLADGATRVPTGPRSAEAEVLDALPRGDVRAAMDSLPDGFRTAVYFADVQGYTYAETAAMLNVPMGTVMSRVSRGRQRLRSALAHLDHGAAPAATSGFGAAPAATSGFGAAPAATSGFGAAPAATSGFGAAPAATSGFGVNDGAAPCSSVA
jgi:RNA polymerase sigma-70 factor (ECF subfamily)